MFSGEDLQKALGWLDQYLFTVRRQQLLAGAAARLTKPKLTACWRHWQHDWEEAQRVKAERGYAAMLSEQRKARAGLEDEVRQLKQQLAAVLAALHLDAPA